MNKGLPEQARPTRVVVRAVSRDAKVVSSAVGGASVRIIEAATGGILAEGRQEGSSGDTDRIMIRSRRRGETVYGTPGSASFSAEIPLRKPTQVEIRATAPLAYPQALQSAAKTLTLIPGRHLEGEGVILELDGLIVRIMELTAAESGREGRVAAEVRML
jgi:hypothetical protein